KREDREAFRYIIQRDALAWAVAEVSPQEIDKINILKASFLAMHRALVQLKIRPELLLIDGNRFVPYGETPHECIIKGDGKYLSIAAASILAKTHRDEVMERFAADYPQYGWDQNVGYPTPAHRKAIAEHGTTPHHRMSFKLLPDQLELFEKEEKKS
ncbi:MAG TPA: ribonuclease HII, partial [Cytophagales bacterium]|nr:ribonuclease HII [Cytophagales bacterium]